MNANFRLSFRSDVQYYIEPNVQRSNIIQSDEIKKLQEIIESQTNSIQMLNGAIQELRVKLDSFKKCCQSKSDEARRLKQQIQSLNDMIQTLNTCKNCNKNYCQSPLAEFSAKAAQTQDAKVSNQNISYLFDKIEQ